MPRLACLLLVLACGLATAAPVPKVTPDPLPDGALVRLGSARFRGPNTDGVTFSKDGKTLYATDDRNTVLRWDARTGKPLDPITFDVKDTVCSRVRGDRAFIVEHPTPNQGAHDSIIHVFELPSGKSRGKFDPKHYIRFTQSNPGLHEVDISADGRRIAFHSHNDKKKKVYDVSGDEPSEVLSLDIAYPGNVLLTRDGGRLLVAAESVSTVYDVKGGDKLFTIPASIRFAAFTPDGSKLIGLPMVWKYEEQPGGVRSGKGIFGRITTWDVSTGKELAAPNVEGQVWQFACSSAATVFVSRSAKEGPVIARWNLKTGKEEWSAAVPFVVPTDRDLFARNVSPFPMFAVSADGTRVVVSDRFSRVALLDATTGKWADDPTGHPSAVRWAGFSADGRGVTTASDYDVREWDAVTGEAREVGMIPDLISPTFVGATPDLLVWRDWKGSITSPQELIAWDRKTKKLAWRKTMELGYHVTTAGDGILVVRGGVEKELFSVYDKTGKLRDKFEVSTNNRYWEATGFSADTMLRFGTLDADKAFHFAGYSLKSGEKSETRKFPWDDSLAGFRAIASSADGKQIGIASIEAWKVFDMTTGQTLASGQIENRIPAALPFAPDGSKVMLHMFRHSLVQVVELKDKGNTWTLDGKAAHATAVAFSPDGKKAIVGYRDGTALIWDVSK